MDAWQMTRSAAVTGRMTKGREDGVIVHFYERWKAGGRGEERRDVDHFCDRGVGDLLFTSRMKQDEQPAPWTDRAPKGTSAELRDIEGVLSEVGTELGMNIMEPITGEVSFSVPVAQTNEWQIPEQLLLFSRMSHIRPRFGTRSTTAGP